MQPPDNKHKCPVCEATFTRSQHVARHMRSHTGDRPYKCTHCGDQFARSDLLSRHVNKCHSTDGKPPPVPRRRGGNRAAVATGSSAQAAASSQQKRQQDSQAPTFSHNDTTAPITDTSLATNALGMPTLAPQPFQFQAGYGQSVIDSDQKRRRFNHAYGWPDSQSVTVPNQSSAADYTFPSLDNGIPATSSSKYARPGASAMPLYDTSSLSLPPLPSLYASPAYPSSAQANGHGLGHGRSTSASATLMALRGGHGYRSPSDPGLGGNASDGNYSDFSTSSASSSAVHLPLDYSAIGQIHSRAGETSQMGSNRALSLGSRGAPSLRHSQALPSHTSTGLTPIPLENVGGFNASGDNLAPSGTFSSAFGLMSLDDPAVLAGLANDGVPFFSHTAPGANNQPATAPQANGTNSAPSYLTQFPPTGFTPRGLTPRDGIPTGFTPREGEMGDFKDFWATFIRDPNPTNGGLDPGGPLGEGSTERGGRPDLKSWNSGATVVPGGYGRPSIQRQHSRSFPTTKNPSSEMVGRLEEQARNQEDRAGLNRSGGTLHNAEALRSYEQAVLARKAPQLTFTPRRGKARMSGDAAQLQQGSPSDPQSRNEQANAIPTSNARGDANPAYGGQMPQMDGQQRGQGYLGQPLHLQSPTQASVGIARSHLTPANFERQPSLGPGTGSSGSGSSPSNTTDSRPGTSSGVRMSQPIHPPTLAHFAPNLYTRQHSPYPGGHQSLPPPIQPLQGSSSPYSDDSNQTQTLSSRPSYKRLASQTLVSATSKRAKESDDHESDSFSFRFGLDNDADDEGAEDDRDPDLGRPMTASSTLSVSTDGSWANLNYVRRMSNPENNVYGAGRLYPHQSPHHHHHSHQQQHSHHASNLNRMALTGARIASMSNTPPALGSSIPENPNLGDASSLRKDDPTVVVNPTAVAQQ